MIRGKVAVLGAAGGIGQPLSLLLKELGSTITQLALYDIANMGMAVDLSHISTNPKVSGHSGEGKMSWRLVYLALRLSLFLLVFRENRE